MSFRSLFVQLGLDVGDTFLYPEKNILKAGVLVYGLSVALSQFNCNIFNKLRQQDQVIRDIMYFVASLDRHRAAVRF